MLVYYPNWVMVMSTGCRYIIYAYQLHNHKDNKLSIFCRMFSFRDIRGARCEQKMVFRALHGLAACMTHDWGGGRDRETGLLAVNACWHEWTNIHPSISLFYLPFVDEPEISSFGVFANILHKLTFHLVFNCFRFFWF